jgi:hypothetical protein
MHSNRDYSSGEEAVERIQLRRPRRLRQTQRCVGMPPPARLGRNLRVGAPLVRRPEILGLDLSPGHHGTEPDKGRTNSQNDDLIRQRHGPRSLLREHAGLAKIGLDLDQVEDAMPRALRPFISASRNWHRAVIVARAPCGYDNRSRGDRDLGAQSPASGIYTPCRIFPPRRNPRGQAPNRRVRVSGTRSTGPPARGRRQ